MKKIFTIILAVGTVTFASAQSSSHDGKWSSNDKGSSRDMVLGNHNSNEYKSNSYNYNPFSFSTGDRDEQIQRINREFDQKITEVKWDRHLRSRQKTKQITMLEKQRDEQIRQIQMHFSDSRDRNFHQDDHNRKW
jgi:DNA-binding helix-hairpin-helix protein with protein kinase domain